MVWITSLLGAALILSVSLLHNYSVHGVPLVDGQHPDYLQKTLYQEETTGSREETTLESKSQAEKSKEVQAKPASEYPAKEVQTRSAPQHSFKDGHVKPASEYPDKSLSKNEAQTEEDDDLFKDIDPQTLAAVLLEALNQDSEKQQLPGDKYRSDTHFQQYGGSYMEPEVPALQEEKMTEKVHSRTRSSGLDAAKQATFKENAPSWKEEEEQDEQDLEKLKSMLEELQKYSTTSKRERSNPAKELSSPKREEDYDQNQKDILKELEEFQELMKDKQQATEAVESKEERSLYSREKGQEKMKYLEELAERKRLEAKQAEEEKIEDIASDLLLQYLLKGEENIDQDNNGKEEQEAFRDETKKNSFLFEDEENGGATEEERHREEDTGAEDKRSNEEGDDIDPQTIDKLIEISSKLHLPADDVIDIINDVEKKKKDSPERIEPKHRQSHRQKVRTPPARHETPHKIYYPSYQTERSSRRRMKEDVAWNDVLSNDLDYEEVPIVVPRRYRPKQNTYPNYIRPRTFQQPRQYYYKAPGLLMQREDYYDDSQEKEEELENYIEKILLKHPEVFQ
ncbi:neurosecretory protein VGF [Microcaecilia unicolor]|uniref:Neurosecretory protein VGF n=1 Tax=Microcaecilia unicolor TaxID=1415580 RepID=A0A6P7WKI0_9AMPH|nr:neurosecretory protein VGF [Microcaecilia unicolor]